MKRIIGLEIGSSRIVAAVAEEDGLARVVLGAEGSWPSSVELPRGEVGPAVHLRGDSSGVTILDRWKWDLGAAWAGDAARRSLAGVRDALADRGAGDAELTVVALSSAFGDARSFALMEALASVGFPSLRAVDESCATALGVGRTWLKGRGLVIDLGARHLSAAVVALSGDRITALADEGTDAVHLDLVADGVARRVAEVVAARGVALDARTGAALRRDVARALGARRGEGPLEVRAPSLQAALGEDAAPTFRVDDDALAWIREEVLLKAHELAEAALEHAGVGIAEVARVWVTGACSRDESIRAALAGHLRREVLSAPVDLIACGAARFGAELLGRISRTPIPVSPSASVRPVSPQVTDLSDIAAMVEVDRGRHVSSTMPEALPPPIEEGPRPSAPPPSPSERPSARPPPSPESTIPARPLEIEHRLTPPPDAPHPRRLPTQGEFRGPRNPVEILGLPLTRAPREDELARPYLPVLLLQLASAHATGVLSLSRDKDDTKLLLHHGGVCVAPLDRPRVLRVMEWEAGTFRWATAPVLPAAAKLRVPLLPFVAAGLRNGLRNMTDAAVLAAFGPKLSLSPALIPERRKRAEGMDLGATELRAVDHILDGSRDVPTLLSEGYLGRLTLMRLLLLLDAFGVVRWVEPAGRAAETPQETLARRLAHMGHEDHFTVLGLHWTATHDEVIAAWERFQSEYGAVGRWAKVDRAVAARVLKRGEEAWERLRDDKRRVQYRHDLHPDVDEVMLSTVVAAQAELLAFRGEDREARAMRQLASEMASSPPPGPSKGH